MMRITLSTSPHVQHAAVLQRDFRPSLDVMYCFAPVGLLSLIGQMRQSRPQDDYTLYDINRRIMSGALPLNGNLYSAIANELIATGADIIGFMTECDSYHHVLHICDAIMAGQPSCKVVLGGPHASSVAFQTMRLHPIIDAIVIGEGELSFPELVEAYFRGSEAPIPGTLRRLGDGSIVNGGLRALIDDMDTLPIPAYDLYSPDIGEAIFLEVGRGCPFQCEFCSTAPYWHRKHRVKSAARIANEIRIIKKLFGERRIHFTHDLFTANQVWVMDVCKQLISDGQPIRWTCSARADTVDKPLLELMAKAGCDSIYFGLESGSERILHSIKKNIPLSQSLEAIQLCLVSGITPTVGFIVGFPYEDLDSLKDTISIYEEVLRMGCKHAHLFSYNPFAGSPLYPKLELMFCDGHFVDLPLDTRTDSANRDTIASDQHLFSSYFRPAIRLHMVGEEGMLSALDELSPLVEATLMPTLVLAKCIGGMYEVFLHWVRWIKRVNTARGVASWRIGYGSPAMFARFVFEELRCLPKSQEAAVVAAQAIEINLRIGELYASDIKTIMTSHRFPIQRQRDTCSIGLTSQLSCNNIVAILASDFDLRPVFHGEIWEELPRIATFLIWQLSSTGSIRLLEVDKPIFDVVQTLSESRLTAGDLLLKKLVQKELVDPDCFLDTLSSLAEAGILKVGGYS